MDLLKKLDLVKSVGEEIITEDELKILFETKDHPIAYDGFEPSGMVHIAQGIVRANNINKMIKAGCKFKILVADWHAWANNKMGGDLEKIQKVGEYLIEVWKACGIDESNVEFVWANELVKDPEYWKTVFQIGMNSTLNRTLRCVQIMGRKESESLTAAQLYYPSMQAADIFHLGVDIAQLGMDQRKINVLAREIAPKLGFWKPVAVHHSMILGLLKPSNVNADSLERKLEMKMSKSKPDTAIFMTDPEAEIKRKIQKAYCLEKVIKDNPVLEYAKFILFENFKEIKVERPKKFGGDLVFGSYKELENSFVKGELHPADLKNAVAHYLNDLIAPIRKHFEKNGKAKELLAFVLTEKANR